LRDGQMVQTIKDVIEMEWKTDMGNLFGQMDLLMREISMIMLSMEG